MEQTPAQLPAAIDGSAPAGPARAASAMLRELGAGRLAALGLTAVALLGLFAHLIFRAVDPGYTLLYAGLETGDSAAIVQRLETMAVPFRLRDDGSTILVPVDQALRLRLGLAEEGLPRGGSVGYEIFDQTGPLGTTDFLANVNLKRALEGELARTIVALADVRAARVHLVLPRRELFRRDQIEPSASITLRMAGGRRLNPRQVQAVRHLVAAAVPALDPERITLVDDQGTLLARGGDAADGSLLPSQAEEHRTAVETRLKRMVEDLLERSLGPGRVRAEINADIDFDRVTTTEETYDPEGQVVRSTQSIEEERQQAERDQDDAVTVGNNLPNAAALGGEAGRSSNETTVRSEEMTNYEISRRVRNHTQSGGRLRRLSVAVLVDGRLMPDATGQLVRIPLEPRELEQLAVLVRSAVGFDADRGDVVEVVNMPFSDPPALEIAEPWLPLGKDDLVRLAELLVIATVALLLILLVVRPALRQLLPAPQPALAGAGAPLDAIGEGGKEASAAEGALPPGGERRALAPPEPEAGRVDVANVEGTVRADLINRVMDAIEHTPDDVIAIIRNWLHEK
jgi:flagellar M-ring protein FliF